jgi:HSP20 family protein
MNLGKRWDIRQELNNLRDNMNRILEEGIASVSGTTLALDMYETEDAIVIETNPLPGLKADDIEVSITGDVLTIRGEIEQTDQGENVNYLRKERRYGDFSRSIAIPRPVKAEQAAAAFKDNILRITIPKADEARPRVINIKSTDS